MDSVDAKGVGARPADDGVVDGIAFDDTGPGRDAGRSTTPPIVFLHGMSWDRRIWQPVVAGLQGRFRCVALDLPGHGGSADLPATADYEYGALAARLHRMLAGLGITRPLIVGHSLGGAIASFYAGLFPVQGVVNLDQSLRMAPMVASLDGLKDVIRTDAFPALWAEFFRGLGLAHLPRETAAWAQSLSRPRQEIVLNYWDPLFGEKGARMQDHLDAHLRKIAAPYVAIHGRLPDNGYRAWLRARLAHAEIHETGVACHMPHLLAPDLLTEAVTRLAA